MKVLRILRRKKIRLSFVLFLFSAFIVNTYAWFAFDRNTEGTGLVASVSSWGVEFVLDGTQTIEEDEFTITIDDFYPGMSPVEKRIDIYHIGKGASKVYYNIDEIYLYGRQVYKNYDSVEEIYVPETVGEEVYNAETGITTCDIFGNVDATIYSLENTNYDFYLRYPTPFTAKYSYNSKRIAGENKNGDESKKVWTKLNFSWENNEDNNIEDTKLGNMAYDFRQSNPDEPAIKIIFKITARKEIVQEEF